MQKCFFQLSKRASVTQTFRAGQLSESRGGRSQLTECVSMWANPGTGPFFNWCFNTILFIFYATSCKDGSTNYATLHLLKKKSNK